MFTYDTAIDAVQTSKKTFVKTFVTNSTVADALNQFVDAQTAYTKDAVKTGVDTFTTLAQESVKAMQSAMKFDYAKFGEGVMKAYQATTK